MVSMLKMLDKIPLKKYIEGCINGEEDHDINQYAETNKQFDTVLEEVIQCMDNALIDKIIHCLHKLTRKSDVILRVWQRIAQLKLKESIEKTGVPCRIPRTAVAFRHGKPKPCDCSII